MSHSSQTGAAGVLCAMFVGVLVSDGAAAAVTARRGRLHLPIAKYADDNAVFMENEFLKLGISGTQKAAGAVMGLVYKPTGHELGPRVDTQGYFRDRMGQKRGFWSGSSGSNFRLEIVSQGEDKAVARMSYVWHRENTDVRLIKEYTLAKGESVFYCTWKIENVGKGETNLTPWIKNVGGIGPRDKTALLASSVIMQEGGLAGGGDPVTNWDVRRSSASENTEALPMVSAVYTFEHLLKYYNWANARKPDSTDRRFSLEAVMRNVDLAPGESWQTTSAIAVSANLKEPLYVAPELAAGVTVSPVRPRAGQKVHVTLHIAPSVDMGPRRLEGDVAALEGGDRIALPNREVELRAGKITDVTYAFTPPGDGAYTMNIGVFDGQPLQRLGVAVNSQRNSIEVPVVVGPKPQRIVRKWDAGGTAWKGRDGRRLTAYRTLVTDRRLKAGQFLVPERIYPEDEISFDGRKQPAYLRMAANQHESFQFAVEVAEGVDIMNVTVDVGRFVDNAGNAIDDVRLFETIYLTTETPSKYNASFPVGHYADPLFQPDWHELIPNAPLTKRNVEIKRGCRRRVFWVTLKTPPDAERGVYRSEVTLSVDGRRAAMFPVEARVSGFALPTRPSYAPSTGMVGWGSRNTVGNFGLSKSKAKALPPGYWGKHDIDAYRRLILEYGWSPTMWSGLKMWKELHDYGRGMTVFSTNAERGSEAHRWLEEHDLMQYAFMYPGGFDEHGAAEIPAFVEMARGFHARSDVPLGDCYYGNVTDEMRDLVDVWIGQVPTSKRWGTPTGPLGWGHKAVEAKKRGVKFYAVNASLIWFVELDPVAGRGQFWDDFVVGYDGRYVYSTCRWTNDLYEGNYTGGQGNYLGCTAYLSPRGVTTSIRMESLRDGVYDFDYLTLLKKRVEAARKTWRTYLLADAIKEAESILHDKDLQNRVRTVEKLHAMRERVADLIEKLPEP